MDIFFNSFDTEADMSAKLLIFTILFTFWHQVSMASPGTSEEGPVDPEVITNSAPINFESALKYYDLKDYAQSIGVLEKLLESSDDKAKIHYNLFVAHFAGKNMSSGLFHLRESLFLSPGYSPSVDALTDLPNEWEQRFFTKADLFKRINIEIFLETNFQLSIFIGLIFFALFLRSLIAFLKARKAEESNSTCLSILGTSIALFVISLVFIGFQYSLQLKDFATVKSNINAKVTPSENSPGILDLLEGEMVVVLDSKKPWYNIEDFNGRKAWVHEDQIFLSKED